MVRLFALADAGSGLGELSHALPIGRGGFVGPGLGGAAWRDACGEARSRVPCGLRCVTAIPACMVPLARKATFSTFSPVVCRLRTCAALDWANWLPRLYRLA